MCAKFHEIISNGISHRLDTISILKITKENNSAKNAGGATVFNLCTSSVMLYISTKFWFKQYCIHRKYIHVSTIHNGTGSDSKQSAYM